MRAAYLCSTCLPPTTAAPSDNSYAATVYIVIGIALIIGGLLALP